ncbi:MAG: peptidyl-prolyl cis-trans isomerase [Myxococcota bacterium]
MQPAVQEGPAVAKVGITPITRDQIVEAIRAQGQAAPRRYKDVGEVKQFVEDQVRLELLAQAALERGLDHDPEVIAAARKIMVRKLLERDLGEATFNEEGVVVSEKEMQSYYDRNRDQYMQPEMRRIAHIQLSPDEKGQSTAAALITELAAKTDNRALFKTMAQRFSTASESKDRGGELLFKTKQELASELGVSFANDVFSLATNEMAAQPVQSTKGWHVVRVVAVREALARPIDEVRDEIRERLLKNQRSLAFDKYLAELRARYPIAVYDDKLALVLEGLQRSIEAAQEPTP